MAQSKGSVDQTLHAPHCEVGCAANVARRVGVDLARQVIGAHWASRMLVREVGTFPQPLLDRTQVTFSAQGEGWPALLARMTGGEVTSRHVPREELLSTLHADRAEGGTLLFMEDRACPWLDSAHSPGMLPHVVVPDGVAPDGSWQLIEGHSWWRGRYAMSEQDLLAASYPDPDPHHVAGRVLSLRIRPSAERAAQLDTLARQELAAGLRTYLAAECGETETPAGRIVWANGPQSVPLLVERLRGWDYLCPLAARNDLSTEHARDVALGRYLFLALTDELAFAAYARAGTLRLVEGLGLAGAVGGLRPDEAWRLAWRSGQKLYRRLDRQNLSALFSALEKAAEVDVEYARRLLKELLEHHHHHHHH
uniref:CcbD n=1 Tax=Streptomyces caelestis TaxID=36816 RepID=UPI0026F37D6A|nr:Chain A, CcbD [Streptomyces caelestis]7YN2_B Chain B, CcbD [Streptomyces caelestis]